MWNLNLETDTEQYGRRKCLRQTKIEYTHDFVLAKCTSSHQHHTGRETYVFHFRVRKTSWSDASKLCSQTGGYLPAFRSRGEVYDFIALMLLPEGHMNSTAYFLGIRSKVSVFLCAISFHLKPCTKQLWSQSLDCSLSRDILHDHFQKSKTWES